MPNDPPRRIILEKSSTVRRRYQRSNKRFQFTPAQLAQIEREEKAIARAKELREKEKQRIAKKRLKAEKEAKAREERKRLGLPDPNAPKVPLSQPLLSNFLCWKPATQETTKEERLQTDPDPTTTETDNHNNGGDAESNSVGGDTEVDSDFDDLDEEMEKEFGNLDDTHPLEDEGIQGVAHDTSKESLLSAQEDEFSDCSAFDDEEIMKEAEAVAATLSTHQASTLNTPSTTNPALLQPPNVLHKGAATPVASFGDSFRDDTAAYLEEVFARGCGDSFSELVGL